jgi:hypothetical protein
VEVVTAPPLHILLTDARAALDAETPTALHTHHAPKLVDADGATSHYPDEGGVGLPFTAAFHRLLAYGERPRQPDTAVRYSLSREVVDYCSSTHPEHVPPDGGKPLCAQLVYLAVWVHDEFGDNLSPDSISAITGRPPAQIRTLLIGALTHAAQWRAALYGSSGPLESASANESLGARLLREHDLVHEERTWRLHQRKYDLPEWPDELADRKARHRVLRCEQCPLLEEAAA